MGQRSRTSPAVRVTPLALKSDGTVLAWGYNQDGELGNGTATNAKETKCENTAEAGSAQVVSSCTNCPTPVEVSKLDGVQAVAAGSAYGLALKEDGTVWAWGANDQGQLGNGWGRCACASLLSENTNLLIDTW